VSAAKLFHAIVVAGVGAAAACGGRAGRGEVSGAGGQEPVSPSISLAGFADAEQPEGVFWPTSCEYRYQYVCESYSPLQGCRCDASRPRSSADCGGAARTTCSTQLCAPNEICEDRWVDCQCLEGAPLLPSDCAGPGQFVCQSYEPEFRDCHCDPERAKTPMDCPKPEDFHCAWLGDGFANCDCVTGALPEDCRMRSCPYRCQSENPRFGCECLCATIR
jgi:hypothetical protein